MPEAKITEYMGDLPVTKKDAEKIAREYILSMYGNIPSVGDVIEEKEYYVASVEVLYPRIIIDEVTNEPKKVRFIKVGKVGDIKIDKMKARILDKPKFHDIHRSIKDKLEFVSTTIEKALVKIGAENFSKLPFAAHMHTPFIDVFSWIIVNDKLELKDLESFVQHEDDLSKYKAIIDALISLGLLGQEGTIIVPGNIFIGIEEKYKNSHDQLEAALAYFFKEGYEYINSIRWVLGPHLTLSRIIYEKSLEYGEIIPVKMEEIEAEFSETYGTKFIIKLPRYLIQLESVNIVTEETRGGEIVWLGNKDIFNRLIKDATIDPLVSVIE